MLAATVVVPVTQGAVAVGGGPVLPSTISALSGNAVVSQVPAALAPASAIERNLEAAARSATRGTLPGCTGLPPAKLSPNGQMPARDLCTLWDGKTKVRADFAVALTGLNQMYVARFGVDLCVTDGYRTLAQQYAVKNRKGAMAATPGTSNHGLGLAVDLCPSSYAGARYQWLRDVGMQQFDIDNPLWARKSKIEPWHWEFMSAVAQDNSLNGRTAKGRG
ncbi:MAG: M15 family metallopeptidase [Micrococcales bacterium]|nr:M15 family metallopeptidase [Micrococcales bacterium]